MSQKGLLAKMDRQEELRLLVSTQLISNLRETFTPDYFVNANKTKSADYQLGFMCGICSLINYLENEVTD